jgi:hypothetical protein
MLQKELELPADSVVAAIAEFIGRPLDNTDLVIRTVGDLYSEIGPSAMDVAKELVLNSPVTWGSVQIVQFKWALFNPAILTADRAERLVDVAIERGAGVSVSRELRLSTLNVVFELWGEGVGFNGRYLKIIENMKIDDAGIDEAIKETKKRYGIKSGILEKLGEVLGQ